MSADDSKNPDKSTDQKKKDEVIRADMVGGLERDEESVVDWIDDEPTPTEPPPEAAPEEPADVTPETLPPEPEPEPPSEPESEAPPAPLTAEDNDISKEEAPPEPLEKQPPPMATEPPKPEIERPAPAASTKSAPAEPAKPAPAARPAEAAASKGIQKHMRPVETPEEPKPRQSMTSRILLYGGVLIIVVVTVMFFLSYEPEAPAPLTAETGLLFHKITPVPTSVTSGPATRHSVPAQPPSASVKPVPARTAPEPQKVSAPAQKPVTPTVPATPKPPAPKKTAAIKTKPVAQAKAYVPRRYPYAIHVASFQSVETAREKLVDYRRGFQAYLVRTDLEEKGIWYRLFLGHIPTATSALDAIKKYNLKGALVARNRFACLLGSYTATDAADQAAQELTAKGFLPYTVAINKVYHLFVGAHPTAEAAGALLMDLAASGFSSELTER